MERPLIPLVATIDAAGAVSPSPAALLPVGFDICGAQATFAVNNYAGGTVQAVLEGSNDSLNPVNWSQIVSAVGTARNGDGVEMIGAGAAPVVQILLVGQFKWVRLNLVLAGGPALDGVVSANLVTPGQVGSGQAGT